MGTTARRFRDDPAHVGTTGEFTTFPGFYNVAVHEAAPHMQFDVTSQLTARPARWFGGDPLRPLEPDIFDRLLTEVTHSLLVEQREKVATHNAVLECLRSVQEAVVVFRALQERPRRFSVPVNALPRADLRLRAAPLWVLVTADDEETFTAEVSEVGAVGYGETAADAVANAVESVCDIWDELSATEEGQRGPRPAKWFAALQAILEPIHG